jgi:antitoxin component of RelBE/YafQ-DinJ toxin-antitoxin module
MDVLSTKVPPPIRKAVEAKAARYGMTPSEYLRFQLRKLADLEPDGIDELDEAEETVKV